MKILYVNIKDESKQGDYLDVITLRALRSVLGDNCIDYPKKKILYGDWTGRDKSALHGKGFTIFTPPLEEIADRNYEDVDVIVYGFINKGHYVNDVFPELDNLNKPIVYIDGHDDPDIVKTPCFKHELHSRAPNVFPMNLAIPRSKVMEIDFSRKTQTIQKTAPPYSKFHPQLLGIPGRKLYIFDKEEDYYDDMANSWFGLSCRKGSWDALRNYEIMAAGAVLLFRDLLQKPSWASPIEVPAVSYSTPDQLYNIVNTLLPGGKPTEEYKTILAGQRRWLLNNAVEERLGKYIIDTIKREVLNIKEEALDD
jgi:hypothetical protein